MIRIFKYSLPSHGYAIIPALIIRPLAVSWQGDDLVLWAEVSVDAAWVGPKPSSYVANIAVLLTGDETLAPTDRGRPEFIGTAVHPTLLGGQPYVVHVYLFYP